MVDFVGALQAAATGLNVVKELAQINKAYDEGLLKLKIAELSGALAKVQIALSEAQTEAAAKDAEIAKLEASFKQKAEGLIEHAGYLYRKGDDGKPEGRPHCPRCMNKGIVIMTSKTIKAGHPFECPECKSEYQGLASFRY